MDVTSHRRGSDTTEGGANKNAVQSECISSQPTANGTLPHPKTGVDVGSISPPPVCTPPSSSFSSPPPHLPPPRSSTCNRLSCSIPHRHRHNHHHPHRQSTDEKRLSSTKSHTSVKTDAAQIKEVAGEDCCAHCLLACLFCEMLSMCSALGECLACGGGGDSCCCDASIGCCCCCVEAAGEAACSEDACEAALDCGIMEDCCGSSDCLEICLECCSIFFPS
ncbi:hypothetical protein CesoFtcFv8_011855 [Champsocephalus esox]|uniref:MyoD family inhibitor domain-containing protein n=1 Tax=Champsocephalus esox TaxID=159716 RepID=A0AAN8C3I6_9TELE|nr:hypothetical protein CesoFtcFv8_011855 [Champsocephalus esox]